MPALPTAAQASLTRLRRRLAMGLFLDTWPAWASAALVFSGTVALLCRMFVAAAAPALPWLWLTPIVTALPVLVVCLRRAYRPDQIAALADWLAGGQGVLLALSEKDDR